MYVYQAGYINPMISNLLGLDPHEIIILLVHLVRNRGMTHHICI